jgi:hypothetical protein
LLLSPAAIAVLLYWGGSLIWGRRDRFPTYGALGQRLIQMFRRWQVERIAALTRAADASS